MFRGEDVERVTAQAHAVSQGCKATQKFWWLDLTCQWYPTSPGHSLEQVSSHQGTDAIRSHCKVPLASGVSATAAAALLMGLLRKDIHNSSHSSSRAERPEKGEVTQTTVVWAACLLLTPPALERKPLGPAIPLDPQAPHPTCEYNSPWWIRAADTKPLEDLQDQDPFTERQSRRIPCLPFPFWLPKPRGYPLTASSEHSPLPHTSLTSTPLCVLGFLIAPWDSPQPIPVHGASTGSSSHTGGSHREIPGCHWHFWHFKVSNLAK